MNHWKKKHLNKYKDQTNIHDNWAPIELIWDCLDYSKEMPILRNNYMELQSIWNVYVTELDIERTEEWENVFTSL